MNNSYKSSVYAFLVAIACSVQLFGQSPSTSILEFQQVFENQVTNVHQEKVFVDTDKASYITGETIWMGAYCMDASFHQLSMLSKVVNIELLNQSGGSMKQIRVELKDGLGQAQLFISPEIPSGTYTLRAYTNWMKNFDPEFVFHKQLNVINPSASDAASEPTEIPEGLQLDFFPEGGHLVAGLTSKIAIKANDHLGKPVELTGLIFDNNEKEVGKFTTSPDGYASLQLTPEAGKSYFARVAIGGNIQKISLPDAMGNGLVMTAKKANKDSYRLEFQHTPAFPKTLHLIAHTRGTIQQIRTIDLNSEKQTTLNLKELPAGITHITLTDQQFQPLIERLIFNYPEFNHIELQTDKKTLATRQKVVLSLNAGNNLLPHDNAFISLSVTESDPTLPRQQNMVTNLLLTSDIKGNIPNPWKYFNPENTQREAQMDLIMLTNGWSRFDWDTLNKNKTQDYLYPAEINAPILSGTVDIQMDQPQNNDLQLSFPGKSSFMNSQKLEPGEIFHFEVPFRIQNNMACFYINGEPLNPDHITVFSPFDLKTKTRPHVSPLTSASRVFLEKMNANIQVGQIYREYNFINGVAIESPEPETHFHGEPDFLYILDNYTRFETVRDLFIEYIRSAVIRDNKKKSGFYVIDEDILPGKALTLIDGVPILDMDYILNFDPLKIEKIGVVKDVYFMGNTNFQGIINFTTYNGDFNDQELPPYILEKAYHAIQKPRKFYSPDYALNHEALKRIPDLRNTLYWNPSIEFTGQTEIEFYTSDNTGEYNISINGITSSGKPIFTQGSISVKSTVP